MSPRDLIESIVIDGKGPLSHVEDGPFDFFTSNIKSIQIIYFRIKKYIYLIYKTLAQWCLQYRLGFFFQNGAKLFVQ